MRAGEAATADHVLGAGQVDGRGGSRGCESANQRKLLQLSRPRFYNRGYSVKRRTLRKFTSIASTAPAPAARPRKSARRPEQGAVLHHHVYVVLLNPAAAKLRRAKLANPRRDPDKPCLYVGMTGLQPEERLANHLRGFKASSVVRRYGVRLLPEFFAHLNPMPFEAAVRMEQDLAEDLRRGGYTVLGGH